MMIEELPINAGEGIISVQPQQILQHPIILRGTLSVKQVLIQWEGTPPKECTWEDYDYIQQQFSNLNLENKVDAEWEGIVSKPLKIYCRKGKMGKDYARQMKRFVQG